MPMYVGRRLRTTPARGKVWKGAHKGPIVQDGRTLRRRFRNSTRNRSALRERVSVPLVCAGEVGGDGERAAAPPAPGRADGVPEETGDTRGGHGEAQRRAVQHP